MEKQEQYKEVWMKYFRDLLIENEQKEISEMAGSRIQN